MRCHSCVRQNRSARPDTPKSRALSGARVEVRYTDNSILRHDVVYTFLQQANTFKYTERKEISMHLYPSLYWCTVKVFPMVVDTHLQLREQLRLLPLVIQFKVQYCIESLPCVHSTRHSYPSLNSRHARIQQPFPPIKNG